MEISTALSTGLAEREEQPAREARAQAEARCRVIAGSFGAGAREPVLRLAQAGGCRLNHDFAQAARGLVRSSVRS